MVYLNFLGLQVIAAHLVLTHIISYFPNFNSRDV